MEAILEAAEELFSTGGFEGVSVREIAARAGISHALVHRYFGTKDDVYRAVLTRDQERILRAAQDGPDLSSALPLMMADLLGPRRQYATLVSHAIVHGLPWDAKVQGYALRRLLELAAAEPDHGRETPEVAGLDHRFVVAAIVAMTLGWTTLEPWLIEASGLEDLEEPEMVKGLISMAMRMLGQGDAEAEV
jgi:TetR/AcrR family transcriptional regulator, repressor for neighboring sulfatase